jgi:anti-sigma B factor antagonist
MQEELKIVNKMINGVAYVILEGYINMETADDLIERVTEELLEKGKCTKFIFDMNKLEYVSSAGIGFFIDIYDKIEGASGKICFLHMKPSIKRVFELVGFMKYFGEAETFDDAVKYCG